MQKGAIVRVVTVVVLNLVVSAMVVFSAGQPKSDLLESKADVFVKQGFDVWRDRNCAACHSVFGLGGHLGPDLTNAAARRDSAYLNMVLENGLGRMPRLDLTPEEQKSLLAWLDHINKTGVYPVEGTLNAPFGQRRSQP